MTIVRTEDAAEFYKIPFDELREIFISGVLLTKLNANQEQDPVTLHFGLSDLYVKNALRDLTPESTVGVPKTSGPGRDMIAFFSLFFGDVIKEELPNADTREAKTLGDYFGDHLTLTLGYLRDGDTGLTTPAIEEFEAKTLDKFGVPTFHITVIREKFITAFRANCVGMLNFQEMAQERLRGTVALSEPAVSIEKQLDYLRAYLTHRRDSTGETMFSFQLREFNYRRILLSFDGLGGNGLMLSPLSNDAGIKAILPFALALKGEIDIEQVKITTPVQQIEDVEIQFSIRRPAVKNYLGATYCSLSPEKRKLMTEGEINVYEDMIRALQANHCFVGKPKLQAEFVEFSTWAVRQIVYCLEEPSHLKTPALKWLEAHDGDVYQRMEDDFFLPIVYEKLREKFGPLVSKKPERFGGNVDILFGEIPIELKARRGQKTALVDTIIDEKYKPTGQAAAYAAVTGLGCVLVLDIPTKSPTVTNLSACVKVVTRQFPEAGQPTSVVVFIFQCDTPRPSDAR
ncbi:hypothetical protein [Janthinobacterium sp. EB271-G4-7A]|uniref:hypothetical protein n=1 Tax=Janthinobacterium sp. EB271-G4-7A TaxID=2775056 RepID=UPI001E584786|nr:hypothetical protein [Janthinobacterium sp. EB271-G4-7A]MCC7700356.1 hypothetical protein [Janthinobacterium sp. EB271-G4-7A]